MYTHWSLFLYPLISCKSMFIWESIFWSVNSAINIIIILHLWKVEWCAPAKCISWEKTHKQMKYHPSWKYTITKERSSTRSILTRFMPHMCHIAKRVDRDSSGVENLKYIYFLSLNFKIHETQVKNKYVSNGTATIHISMAK